MRSRAKRINVILHISTVPPLLKTKRIELLDRTALLRSAPVMIFKSFTIIGALAFCTVAVHAGSAPKELSDKSIFLTWTEQHSQRLLGEANYRDALVPFSRSTYIGMTGRVLTVSAPGLGHCMKSLALAERPREAGLDRCSLRSNHNSDRCGRGRARPQNHHRI
jgi:hypothetical protein